MSVDIIQAQYEQLAGVANQFDRNADRAIAVQQQMVRSAQALRQGGWQGRGSTAFFVEIDGTVLPAVQRLIAALKEAQRVTLQIEHLMRQAEEEAARPFREQGMQGIALGQAEGSAAAGSVETSSAASGGAGQSTLAQTIRDIAKNIFGAMGKISQGAKLAAGVLLVTALKSGATYEGQVIVSAPKWLTDLGVSGAWLKGQAGLSGALTHIKADNIATHIGNNANKIGAVGALFSIGKGAFAVADVWHQRADEYASYDTSRRLAAVTVDTTLALVPVVTGIVGTYLGTQAFASVGAGLAAGTPLTAVGGGIIGGIVGGIAGGAAGKIVGDWTVGIIEQEIGREALINTLDTKVVRPIAGFISEAMAVIQTQPRQPGLAMVRFGP